MKNISLKQILTNIIYQNWYTLCMYISLHIYYAYLHLCICIYVHMQGWTATMRYGVTRKKVQKD